MLSPFGVEKQTAMLDVLGRRLLVRTNVFRLTVEKVWPEGSRTDTEAYLGSECTIWRGKMVYERGHTIAVYYGMLQ